MNCLTVKNLFKSRHQFINEPVQNLGSINLLKIGKVN